MLDEKAWCLSGAISKMEELQPSLTRLKVEKLFSFILYTMKSNIHWSSASFMADRQSAPPSSEVALRAYAPLSWSKAFPPFWIPHF